MAQNGSSNGAAALSTNGTENGKDIDESLYSRQLFVLGRPHLVYDWVNFLLFYPFF